MMVISRQQGQCYKGTLLITILTLGHFKTGGKCYMSGKQFLFYID